MIRYLQNEFLLALLSGVLLGAAFPPFPLGILACLGLVPLMIALDTGRHPYRTIYIAMLVFHVITLSWTGGYTQANDVYMMIAGAATMTIHPFFYFIPLGGYLLVKKQFGPNVALIALPLLWVGYEYSHSISEWSFPWLTLGYTQSYDLARVQICAWTGVYGLSMWIVLTNIFLYLVYLEFAANGAGSFSPGLLINMALIVVWYFLPWGFGSVLLSDAPPVTATPPYPVRVGMVQSNVNPWDKWSRSGYSIVTQYIDMTRRLTSGPDSLKPQIVLWPETAVPYYLLTGGSTGLREHVEHEVTAMGTSVLTGLPHAVFYQDSSKAPVSAKRSPLTGERYDAFNAAAFFQPGTDSVAWYGKMKFVPLAERVPYAEAFSFLGFMQWGVGIGGWQIGRDSTIFVERKSGTRFNTLICYESVYPDLVSAYVRKGSEFIALITIDSWWGHMSGAYQHMQYAIFRAVENRRWVARCAVGGISCYIDPYGRVYDATELFTQKTLCRTIGREVNLSFYTRQGDLLGEASMFLGAVMIVGGWGQMFLRKQRRDVWKQP